MDAGQLYGDSKVNVMCLLDLCAVKKVRWLPLMCLAAAMPALAEELPDPVSAGWHGRSVCEVLQEDSKIRIFRCIFPPGVGHERHFHPRHFGYALSGGTMRITNDVGTREVTLNTGSYFFSEGIDWHEGLNVGDTVVSYLMIEPK